MGFLSWALPCYLSSTFWLPGSPIFCLATNCLTSTVVMSGPNAVRTERERERERRVLADGSCCCHHCHHRIAWGLGQKRTEEKERGGFIYSLWAFGSFVSHSSSLAFPGAVSCTPLLGFGCVEFKVVCTGGKEVMALWFQWPSPICQCCLLFSVLK